MSWGYGPDDGPKNWNKLFKIADGDSQSPVDIKTSDAKFDANLNLKPLSMNYSEEKELEIVNTGHSVMAKIQETSELSGGPLSCKYRLKQFHLHWGSTDARGSEHTIDGKEYSSELHLVHWNCDNYKSFEEAADKKDGLSVVGVMIKSGQEHPGFKVLCENVCNVKDSGSNFTIAKAFNPKCLLPDDTTSYWTYPGSLTTPPLYESVKWIVLKDSIEISDKQLACLRALQDEHKLVMQDNFRPPCPFKERKLLKSFE